MGYFPFAAAGIAVAAIGSTAETVGGSVDNGVAATASRSDHKHAITTPSIEALGAATDVATLNASTTAHGLLPKLSNVSTEFLNGVGAFATPAAGTEFTPTANATTSSGAATANGKRGRITVAAGDSALGEFTITNSYVAATSVVLVCASSNQSALLQNARPSSGSFIMEFNNPPGAGATLDYVVLA